MLPCSRNEPERWSNAWRRSRWTARSGSASPAAFRAFTEELASQVATLASKYDHATAKSRRFRVVVGSHPVVTKTAAEAAAETARHQRQQQHRNTRNSARRDQ